MKKYSLVGNKIVLSASLNKYGDSLHRVYVKQEADTIRELCECFIVFDGEYTRMYYNFDIAKLIKGDCYGCIKVKNGWKYVAKLNEKGELELL